MPAHPPHLERLLVSSGAPWESQVGYSRAVRVGNQVAVSGTVATGSAGEVIGGGDAYAQTRFCIEKIQAALAQAGAELTHVIRTRIYVSRIEDWPEIGRAHCEFFGEIRPATTLVEVSRLISPDFLVEIEVDAVIS